MLAIVAALAGLYSWSAYRLEEARRARRNDAFAEAEELLSHCWRLPGLANAIDLEWLLLGVQQGDASSEGGLQPYLARRSLDPGYLLEAQAKGCLATFRWNEAREYAERLLEKRPQDAQGLWIRGQAWTKLQQESKAREDLLQATALAPGSVAIRLALAELLHKQGELRQATAHYELLRRQLPDDARVLLGLAHCREDSAELPAASAVVDELLSAQPKLVVALAERARLSLRLGWPAEGEQQARRAVTIAPHHAEANAVLRLCLEAGGQQDEAFDRQLGADERVRTDLWHKLRDTPHDPAVCCEVGRWTAETGQQQESAGWFFLALHEDKQFAPAHAALAKYFERDGQHQRAKSHRRQAGIFAPPRGDTGNVRFQVASPQPALQTDGAFKLDPAPSEASSEQVHEFCGACHAYPPPDSMPKHVWRKEVKQGYDFFRDSKSHQGYPSLESVILYYENRAPDRLPMLKLPDASANPPVIFERTGSRWLAGLPPFPGTSHVSLTRLSDAQKLDLLVCDTRLDQVLILKPYEHPPAWQPLAPVLAPSHAEVVDLDGDRQNDILVASLGQFFPTDDKVGSVVWLRGLADGKFAPVTLLEGVGRVADVQAADFIGDNKLDLVVAVFGWRNTGEILLLENQTEDWQKPRFVPRRLDDRHGTIHVPVADIDCDGRADFVAMISQEHETVVAFLNRGEGQFQKETLFAAPHPTFGSSGIQLVDLDGDGDLDVLMTNGDVLDRPYVLKAYHGVQWLENQGTYPFTHRPLTSLPGASRAVAADLDGDQDEDIVAVSFLPGLEFPERERLGLSSVILLEQTEPGKFNRHVLETGTCDHFACAAGDWNGDGRPDLAIGNYSWKRSRDIPDAVMLWKNAGPQHPSSFKPTAN